MPFGPGPNVGTLVPSGRIVSVETIAQAPTICCFNGCWAKACSRGTTPTASNATTISASEPDRFMSSLLPLRCEAPGEQPLVQRLEEVVGDQADDADDHDAEDDLARVEQGLAVGDHVADAAGGPDQLGHDDVGPRPAENQTQR